MTICFIGKYPPIQGGVSTRTYWLAHGLAQLGHKVHVITNAKEVQAPYGMLMREQDWAACEADYGSGSVRVHWTEQASRRQFHIPWHNPFVTKLSSLAANVASQVRADLVFSYYLEPYGIAGHLASQMTGLPHVIKLAGSDAGRLWRLEQFGPLYEHICRAAARVLANTTVVEKLVRQGVDRSRFHAELDFTLPEHFFHPTAHPLDYVPLVSNVYGDPKFAAGSNDKGEVEGPFIGIYGKLGELKGTFHLLGAIKNLLRAGVKAELLVMGHASVNVEEQFRNAVVSLGLKEVVWKIPFLPHWRVPEFIRLCKVVCCLEQGFPISFHAPILPREVLLCGGCLIATTELLRKLPNSTRLVHGYNCLAVQDVRDEDRLSQVLQTALDHTEAIPGIRRRAHEFGVATQRHLLFPNNYERLFTDVLRNGTRPEKQRARVRSTLRTRDFQPASMVLEAIPPERSSRFANLGGRPTDPRAWLSQLIARLNEEIAAGDTSLELHLDFVKLDRQIAECDIQVSDGEFERQLFRLGSKLWPTATDEILELRPKRVEGFNLEEYRHDANSMMQAVKERQLPGRLPESPTLVATSVGDCPDGVRVVILPLKMLEVLRMCDGRSSILQITSALNRPGESSYTREQVYKDILEMFEAGLIEMRC